jgi:hypothetical protein
MLSGSCCPPTARVRLADIYPTEFATSNISSFPQLVVAAKVYLREDPVAMSKAEAARRIADGTAVRVDMARVAADVVALAEVGLPALVSARGSAISHRTYQSSAAWPTRPYTGALPTDITNLAKLVSGAPITLPEGFCANQGIQSRPLDASTAFPIELHFADDHTNGLGVILPLDLALAAAAASCFTIHVSPLLLVRKVNKPLGRLCFDYTYSKLNSEEKNAILAADWGDIHLPQMIDWCRTWERARAAFPAERLHGYATDYDGWFKRIRADSSECGIYSTTFLLHGVPHLFLPLVEQFGAQESGFHSNVGSRLLFAHMEVRHRNLWNVVLACQYIDDIMGFLPPHLIDAEMHAIELDAVALAGDGALAKHKSRKGERVDGNGWSWFCPDGTLTLTYSILLRMVCVLFHEIPADVVANDTVTLVTLQRLASYLIRACTAMPAMRSFSRGASHNAAKYENSYEPPKFLPQTVVDINAWRAALQFAFYDASWLISPTFVPILLSPLNKIENKAAQAQRQAMSARFIIHADACTSLVCTGFAVSHGTGTPNIDGTAVVPFAYGQEAFPFLAPFLRAAKIANPAVKQTHHADINLLEMIGAVTAILATERLLVASSPLVQPDGRHRGLIHIHTWTDNSSALSWLVSHRSSHPLHAFLLQTLSFAMQRSRLLLTFGHVAGILNVTADAISRQFNVPAGPAVRTLLRSAARCPASRTFTESLRAVSSTESTSPYAALRAALTALG